MQHLATELLKREAGIELLHVPYKGTGPGLVDLLAGQVQITLTSVPSVIPYVKAGRLRALAVTGQARLPSAPDIPTFAESGLPGVDVVIWYGMLAPLNTPRPIIDKLARTIDQIAKSPDVREKMLRDGAEPSRQLARRVREVFQKRTREVAEGHAPDRAAEGLEAVSKTRKGRSC